MSLVLANGLPNTPGVAECSCTTMENRGDGFEQTVRTARGGAECAGPDHLCCEKIVLFQQQAPGLPDSSPCRRQQAQGCVWHTSGPSSHTFQTINTTPGFVAPMTDCTAPHGHKLLCHKLSPLFVWLSLCRVALFLMDVTTVKHQRTV